MNLELLFSLVGAVSMIDWLILCFSPLLPAWVVKLPGIFIPVALSVCYVATIAIFPPASGGYGSFDEVLTLFTNEGAVMAGWTHFLAFDLFVGAWICGDSRKSQISHILILPCLALTFLNGPAGLLLYMLIRTGSKLRKTRTTDQVGA